MSIYAELKKIQIQIKAPKNQKNAFGGFNYRKCEDILQAFHSIDTQAVVVLSDEVVEISGRFYVQATATLYFNDQSISNKALAREAEIKKGMDDSQITGAASSYARKYALAGLFGLDDEKDPDTQDNSQQDSKVIDFKPKQEAREQIEVWMTGQQYQELKNADAATIRTVLNSKVNKDGKRFGIKKEFRQGLEQVLELLESTA